MDNNIRKFGTTRNDSFGGSFGFGQNPPPPSTGGELGDEYCYFADRIDTLVLKRDAGFIDIRQPCKWQIESYSKLKIGKIDLEGPCGCGDLFEVCWPHTSLGPLTVDVEESDGGHMTACELLDNIDSDFKLVVILITQYQGCFAEIQKLIGHNPGDHVGGILENIGQDLECHLLGGEEGREDLFKKILECLCKIEQEPDEDKQEEMFKEMNDKFVACAKKYDKNMLDEPGGREKAEWLLENANPPIYPDDYDPFGGCDPTAPADVCDPGSAYDPPPPPDYSGEGDGWIKDQLSNLYERCLNRIEKLC